MDNRLLIGVIAVLVVIIFVLLLKPSVPMSSLCGDGVCDPGEKESCPDDCVSPVNGTKPNGTSPEGETPSGTCGDGKCDTRNETSQNCPADCAAANPNITNPPQTPNPNPPSSGNLSAYEDSPFAFYQINKYPPNPTYQRDGYDCNKSSPYIDSLKCSHTGFELEHLYSLGVHWAADFLMINSLADLSMLKKVDFGKRLFVLVDINAVPPLANISSQQKPGKERTTIIDYYNWAHFIVLENPEFKYFSLGSENCPGGFADGSPEQYAIYIRVVYRGLKDANQSIQFLPYGSAGNWDCYESDGFYETILKNLDFMEKVEKGQATYDGRYDAYLTSEEKQFLFQADNYDKYLEGHAYSDWSGGGDISGLRESLVGQESLIRTLFTKYGYTNVKLWIAQTGFVSDDPKIQLKPGALILESKTTETTQAQTVLEKYVLAVFYGIEKVFNDGIYDCDHSYLLHSESSGLCEKHAGGLIYDGNESVMILGSERVGGGLISGPSYGLGFGVKKLAFWSYKFMVEKLDGSDWSNVQEVYNSSNVYAYKFTNKQTQKPTYVVWWDYWNSPGETTKQVTIPVSITGTAKITQSVPHFENGLLLQNSGEVYPNFFDVENKQVSGGQLTFTLGQNPVYVESA